MNQAPINLKSAEILIVDDVPTNLNILCQALEPEGYNIIAAPSGEVALQIVARTQPSLILLDIMKFAPESGRT
ncbi:response regulator [Candidatus Poribacteria bacterium]|nr:response regulator [Candidatus Poribacteria bacterium]